MARRLAQVNKQLQRVVAEILQREADLPGDVMVTVSRVEARPNLRSAVVWLYISPLGQAEDVLDQLKQQAYEIQKLVNRALAMRPIPRISFRIDYGADHADTIARRLEELSSP